MSKPKDTSVHHLPVPANRPKSVVGTTGYASTSQAWDKTRQAKPVTAVGTPGSKIPSTYGGTYKQVPRTTPKEAAGKVYRRDSGFTLIPQAGLMVRPEVIELLNMLTYMRPAGSQTEEDFIARFLKPLGCVEDGYGNWWVEIDKPDGEKSPIIWSSHTDTVHYKEGRQGVEVADSMVFANDSSCLGADDTAGIWLMMQMIKAKVPGMYVFHREEECGGHGSTYINNTYKKQLESFKAVIAFDRKGYDSVITHQAGGRCCSDAFAKSLAKIMGGKFALDDGGLFTDSANYTDNVGECTNLSVGYHLAHGPNECQDISFLVQMADVLIKADWSQLVFERKPGDPDPDRRSWSWKGYGYGGTTSGYVPPKQDYKPYSQWTDEEKLASFIEDAPGDVARYLVAHGIKMSDIDDWIWQTDVLGQDPKGTA